MNKPYVLTGATITQLDDGRMNINISQYDWLLIQSTLGAHSEGRILPRIPRIKGGRVISFGFHIAGRNMIYCNMQDTLDNTVESEHQDTFTEAMQIAIDKIEERNK